MFEKKLKPPYIPSKSQIVSDRELTKLIKSG